MKGARSSPSLLEPARPCAVVLEADPDVSRTLVALLAPEIEVHVAGSAALATTVLGRLQRVDLAFLDLALLAGGDELRQLLGLLPEAIRVLLVSGAVTDDELPRCRHLVHLKLVKPGLESAQPGSASVVRALKRATLALPRC